MSLELTVVHRISKTHQISSTFDFSETKHYCLTSRERCLPSGVMLTPLHVRIILLEHSGLQFVWQQPSQLVMIDTE